MSVWCKLLMVTQVSLFMVTAQASSFEEIKGAGNGYFKEEKFERAIETYERAFFQADTDVEKAVIKNNIGQCYLKMGEHDNAIENFERALEI